MPVPSPFDHTINQSVESFSSRLNNRATTRNQSLMRDLDGDELSNFQSINDDGLTHERVQNELSDFSFDDHDEDEEHANSTSYLSSYGNNQRYFHPYLNSNRNFINYREAAIPPSQTEQPIYTRLSRLSGRARSHTSTTSEPTATATNSINLNNSILRNFVTRTTPAQPPNLGSRPQISPNVQSSRINTSRFLPPLQSESSNDQSILSNINRISTETLVNDLLNESKANPLLARHCLHKVGDNKIPKDTIKDELQRFLFERFHHGVLYDKQKAHKRKFPRKRSHKESETESNQETEENYKFDTIRPQTSSFFKKGSVFKSDVCTLSLTSVDINEKSFFGYFSFEKSQSKSSWIQEVIGYSPDPYFYSKISFQGEIIDFENTDLSYKSGTEEFPDSMIDDNWSGAKLDSQTSLYKNRVLRKQIKRWIMLKPFEKLKVNDVIPILTCADCLSELQSKYILLKITLEDCVNTDLIACVDRETGDLDIVSSRGSKEDYPEKFGMDFTKTKFKKIYNFSHISERYVSPTIHYT